ncbi:cytochrome P450 monooxygenase [Acephala macrosclerotiorum]|nr:cytochrome P450 monooxygenase [Acephala macrosclerotiorum]
MKSKLKAHPMVGSQKVPNLHELLIEAHQKYPNMPFTIQETPHGAPTMVLPKRYIDEIKNLPESKLSFTQGIMNRLAGKYTTMGEHDQSLVDSVKIDLTRNIARTLAGLQDEADFAIPSTFGECEDWTPIPFYKDVLRVIALLSGRTFVGLPLCRNEEWIGITIRYTIDAFAAVDPINKISPLWRFWSASSMPQVKRIHEHRANGARLLKPILEERLQQMQDPNFEPPVDMIQFMYSHSANKIGDADYQSHMQMIVSLAAIHTTAMNITHVIYDLAAHPEYITPLREELESVLKEDGGVLEKTSMTKLKKMDSFLKESQRMNPPISLTRQTTSDITLSDGLFIPKGTHTAVSSLGINYDAATYPSPYEFQPFRFSNLRSQPGNENKYQFVTTSAESIAFGHGTHACPGRFFASNEIKVIFAGLLMRYDIKLKEGMGRPANARGKTRIGPDTRAKVLFRRRQS